MKAAVQEATVTDGPSPSGAGTQILIGLVVLAVVSLLTLLFSFLGTISSGALLGMVFGTMKPGRWRVLLVSSVFPLVSLAFAHLLTAEKNLLLAGLCLGVFWTSYELTSLALALERKPETSSPAPKVEAARIEQQPPYDPNLVELQGVWTAESANQASPPTILEFSRDRLTVKAFATDGTERTLFASRIWVSGIGPYRVGNASAPQTNAGPGQKFGVAPWLFKVSGDTLTIGWSFEENRYPASIETYRRSPRSIR
jgi:hypothetical protein